MSGRRKSGLAGAESGVDTGGGARRTASRPADGAPRLRFLAVGDMTPPPPVAEGEAPDDITCLTFAEVSAEALDNLRPDVVFSALVGSGFDCLDLADRLNAAGFRGQYRAVAPTVPDPDLVRREIADRFPALDFDLVFLPGRGERSGS